MITDHTVTLSVPAFSTSTAIQLNHHSGQNGRLHMVFSMCQSRFRKMSASSPTRLLHEISYRPNGASQVFRYHMSKDSYS
jgi:hypothetical protein